jgi:hypothetical protein
MLRKTVVLSGLVLAALAFILDGTATNAEACGGCRRGCGYGGGCGGGYASSYYYRGSYGGGCGSCCTTYRPCCATPAYTCCAPACAAPACGAAACCGTYIYPGTTVYAPAYASYGVRPYFAGPAVPASTNGMPVVVPQGYGVTYRPALVSYSR